MDLLTDWNIYSKCSVIISFPFAPAPGHYIEMELLKWSNCWRVLCNPNRMVLGRQVSVSRYSNIDISEVIAYNSSLSAADRSSLERYLAGNIVFQ